MKLAAVSFKSQWQAYPTVLHFWHFEIASKATPGTNQQGFFSKRADEVNSRPPLRTDMINDFTGTALVFFSLGRRLCQPCPSTLGSLSFIFAAHFSEAAITVFGVTLSKVFADVLLVSIIDGGQFWC